MELSSFFVMVMMSLALIFSQIVCYKLRKDNKKFEKDYYESLKGAAAIEEELIKAQLKLAKCQENQNHYPLL